MSYDLIVPLEGPLDGQAVTSTILRLLEQVGVEAELEEESSLAAHDGGFFPLTLRIADAFAWAAPVRWTRPVDTGFELVVRPDSVSLWTDPRNTAPGWLFGAALAVATKGALRDPQLPALLAGPDLPSMLDAVFALRWPAGRPPPVAAMLHSVVTYGAVDD